MTRVSVIFKNGDWSTVEAKYVFADEITEALNQDEEMFVNVCGIICKPKDVAMVQLDEDAKGGNEDD